MTVNPFSLPPVLYAIVTIIALVGWAALIFFPRRPWANFWLARTPGSPAWPRRRSRAR